jgi:hypothetical protein
MVRLCFNFLYYGFNFKFSIKLTINNKIMGNFSMFNFVRIIFILCIAGFSSILEAAPAWGYFDLGASYQWFDVPKVRAIMQGADYHILLDKQKGSTPGGTSGWGAVGVLGFQGDSPIAFELKGFYTQQSDVSAIDLQTNSIVFFRIDEIGVDEAAEANVGKNEVDLLFFGGDALAVGNLWLLDWNHFSWSGGFSYKRLEQGHHFYGELKGIRVNNFFVEDRVNTDYVGLGFGLRNQTFIGRYLALTLTGDINGYYAHDSLRARQKFSETASFSLYDEMNGFAYYAEGKAGLTLFLGSFTIGMNGLYGYLSHAPRVVHPVGAADKNTHLESALMHRYGLELNAGVRF